MAACWGPGSVVTGVRNGGGLVMHMTKQTIFKCVETAYDLHRMKRAHITSVGGGGARSFLEDSARCGVGRFGLIDFDVVEEANIATQHVFLDDIGRPKVDCI